MRRRGRRTSTRASRRIVRTGARRRARARAGHAGRACFPTTRRKRTASTAPSARFVSRSLSRTCGWRGSSVSVGFTTIASHGGLLKTRVDVLCTRTTAMDSREEGWEGEWAYCWGRVTWRHSWAVFVCFYLDCPHGLSIVSHGVPVALSSTDTTASRLNWPHYTIAGSSVSFFERPGIRFLRHTCTNSHLYNFVCFCRVGIGARHRGKGNYFRRAWARHGLVMFSVLFSLFFWGRKGAPYPWRSVC